MEEPDFSRQNIGDAPTEKTFPREINLNKPKKKKPLFLYFLIVLILVLLGTLGARAWLAGQNAPDYGGNTLQPKKFGLFQAVKNFFFAGGENTLIGQENDRVNILLLGIGGPGHEGPYLSDTNIIASIKPSTKEVALISIPRDLGVKMGDNGFWRINYADAWGEKKNPGQGGEYARQIFSETFKLDIPYYVRVDFTAFEQIINAVGGVEVTVTNPFIDYSFPADNYAYQTVGFSSGTQMMDGTKALQYARSRHGTNGESSDFARSRRQQQILSALKQRIFSFGTFTSPTVIKNIWASLADNVTTNLDISQIAYLASVAKDIDTSKVKSLVLESGPQGYLYSYIADTGAFMLAPKTGNFDAINAAIAGVFDPNFKASAPITSVGYTANERVNSSTSPGFPMPTATPTPHLEFLEGAKIEVQNGTWRAGLASRYQTKLSDQGFTIVTIGNSGKRPIASTTIYLINQTVSNDIVNYLSKQIKGKIEMTLPNWLHDDYDDPNTAESEAGAKFNPETDILVILGTDAKE
ncbi:MAG: LCP family protein [Patescibacteria group bacterium]|nr:LCP family protein [Patescibacteria group bacterium]